LEPAFTESKAKADPGQDWLLLPKSWSNLPLSSLYIHSGFLPPFQSSGGLESTGRSPDTFVTAPATLLPTLQRRRQPFSGHQDYPGVAIATALSFVRSPTHFAGYMQT